MAKIKCVFKAPGGPAYNTEIRDQLREYQFLVDGYVETITLSNGTVVVFNEEGKLIGMEKNFYLKDKNTGRLVDYVCGPAIFVGAEDGEFTSISDEAAEEICKALNFQPTLEVG